MTSLFHASANDGAFVNIVTRIFARPFAHPEKEGT